ncbi:trypsin-like peptidase domain-containing protein [Streptomyces sp. ISL-36]|uniref:VMAP-C domain-containing protein n=1 Tax=Streptomyces sp. ISL-36 TaxID=2819182 RepID=UPI001BE917E4|nr:trypsin-like peptidase domain-containing protein [Streptomyces sp. ISL-36]MBT2439106.1 trypsin-like peptidase domain-containing protein [Streptomyces sp. ISL-36]
MSALDALVRPALVRISDPADGYDGRSDRYWGTGFFIAPGWLLTCAHVVAKGGSAVWRGERAVGVTWQGATATGEVVLAKPRPDLPERELARWDFPDLALVRVPDARDVSCVRLSERPPVITRPIPVSLHGWSRQTGTVGIRQAVGEAHAVDGGALLMRWTLPVEGLSGGPVVDLGRGAVIGLNKGRGKDEGAAVPITALRELYDVPGGEILHEVMRDHDRHHLARYRSLSGDSDWTREQIRLRPPTTQGVGPGRRIHLYGRLAELPPPAGPGEVMHLVDEVKRRVLHEDFHSVLEADPRTWREGVGLLHELRDPVREARQDLGLNAVFLYAAMVVRHVTALHGESPAVTSLADWITDEAMDAHRAIRQEIAQLLTPERPGAAVTVREPRARADVLLEIDSLAYGTRHPWRVKLLFDGHTINPVAGDDVGVERDELEATLRAPLVRALSLGDSGEHLAAVEAVLPLELFDLPVDGWRLAPDDELFGEHALTLGQSRTVVIRPAGRRAGPPSHEWLKRWRAAEHGPLRVIPLRAEVPGTEQDPHAPHLRRETPRQAFARFLDAEGGAVPVYCGRIGSGDGRRAMAAALAAGHPLALWRTDPHPHADCADFHEQAGLLLAEAAKAEGLHRPLRTLRIRAGDEEADPRERSAHAWAENLAVLFDPPDRPPHDPPLQAPPMLGEGDR